MCYNCSIFKNKIKGNNMNNTKNNFNLPLIVNKENISSCKHLIKDSLSTINFLNRQIFVVELKKLFDKLSIVSFESTGEEISDDEGNYEMELCVNEVVVLKRGKLLTEDEMDDLDFTDETRLKVENLVQTYLCANGKTFADNCIISVVEKNFKPLFNSLFTNNEINIITALKEQKTLETNINNNLSIKKKNKKTINPIKI